MEVMAPSPAGGENGSGASCGKPASTPGGDSSVCEVLKLSFRIFLGELPFFVRIRILSVMWLCCNPFRVRRKTYFGGEGKLDSKVDHCGDITYCFIFFSLLKS